MSRANIAKKPESAILLRMSASRKALLTEIRRQSTVRAEASSVRAVIGNVVTTMAAAPRSTLVLALCVGTVIVGPKQIFRTVARWGVAAWVGAAMHKESR